MKTAIIYARVSTLEQANNGNSLAHQEAKLRQYCEFMNFDNVIVKIDSGISGKSTKRPAFQETMELVRGGDIAAVVVYSLSRFARNTADTLESVETFTKYGTSFHSLSEKIDTESPTGRFFLTVMSGLAQLERETTVQRITDVLQHKKANGERVGQIPFGYQLAQDGRTLEPHADEQRAIEIVNELHANGESLQKIADKLNSMNILNKKGEPSKWQKTQIYRILQKAA